MTLCVVCWLALLHDHTSLWYQWADSVGVLVTWPMVTPLVSPPQRRCSHSDLGGRVHPLMIIAQPLGYQRKGHMPNKYRNLFPVVLNVCKSVCPSMYHVQSICCSLHVCSYPKLPFMDTQHILALVGVCAVSYTHLTLPTNREV